MRGIHIPGAVVIGNIDTGNNAGGADLSDINLTAENPDSRITYQCASHHAYLAKDGTIQFVEPDTWPLEYRDGVAVGRHEPEPQATNTFSWSFDLNRWGKNFDAPVSVSEFKSPTGGKAYAVTTGPTKYSGLYARASVLTAGNTYCESLFVHADSLTDVLLIGSTTLGGQSQTVDFKNRTSTIPAAFKYGFDDFPGGWVRYWFSGAATASGSSAFVMYTANAQTFTAWGIQHEDGERPSSVILTNGTPATRAASFVSVKIYPHLTGLRIHYSDGTTDTVQLSADDKDGYPLPDIKSGWSTRYIQRVEYVKS